MNLQTFKLAETSRVMKYFWLAIFVFSILWNGFILFTYFELVHNCILVKKNISAELLEVKRDEAFLLKEIPLNCREFPSDKQNALSKRGIKSPYSFRHRSSIKAWNPSEQTNNCPLNDSENKMKAAECSDLKRRLSLMNSRQRYLEKRYMEETQYNKCLLRATVKYSLASQLPVVVTDLMVELFPGLPPEFIRFKVLTKLYSLLMRISQYIRRLTARCLNFL